MNILFVKREVMRMTSSAMSPSLNTNEKVPTVREVGKFTRVSMSRDGDCISVSYRGS